MFLAPRLQLKKLILWAAPLAGLACGGDGGTDVVLPSLRITTATSGVEIDPDGYSVSIDGQAAQPIGLNAILTVDGIADGQHTVELSGIAGNCGVGGQNPQSVSVLSGSTASLSFEVICSSGTGSIQVVTTTSGAGTDPDGYALLLDGTDRGPIGVSATSSLTGITAGSHSIGLTGLAGNCQISGENPRAVSVPAGGTVQVAFAVSCAAPGATTGNLEVATVTTGPSQDPNGYVISIDGGPGQPIGTNATVTLSSVTAVLHTVELQDLAANCAVTGANPLGAAVPAGGTATISFAVTCLATAGGLTVTISGLPAGAPAAVTVSGPNTFSQALTATSALTGLAPGSYTVSAANVVSGVTTYTPSIARPTVDVVAGGTAAVTVSYTPVASNVTLNLRIEGLYLTQSTQTFESDVPLVAGRSGYLRVFVVANESNTATPTVRVRFRNGSSTTERTITAPGGSTPLTAQEGTLGSSWNLPVDGALIRPGLSIEATVDPGGSIAESNDGDNQRTKALTVQAVPRARIRFVSVQHGSSAPGNASGPGKMALARLIYPLDAVEVDVRAGVFTVSDSLQADGSGWDQVLSDLDAMRLAEPPDDANRIYFGIAKLDYNRNQGIVGVAFPGLPSATTALGWDDPADAGRVVAHELGHIWGRRHSPCGSPPDVDLLYPFTGGYSGGHIGVYGLDVTPPVTAADLRAPSSPDIMGYCFDSPWISDYTYKGVMAFRNTNAGAVLAGRPQPSLLVWGRIVDGRPVLEPAFQIVTRPSLPRRPGPYSVTATATDGTQLFTLSFDAVSAEDDPQGNRHFAFAVPLDQARAATLASLRLAGPGGSVVAESRAGASLQMGAVQEAIVARREGPNVALRWNATAHPTIMVRDPETGEVLSFARGGNARVWTAKGELDLDVSDGVRSQRVRLAIGRP